MTRQAQRRLNKGTAQDDADWKSMIRRWLVRFWTQTPVLFCLDPASFDNDWEPKKI